MNREEIINNYSKSEFIDFLEKDYSKKILELLNKEGLTILEESPIKEERLRYIIAFSKYKDELLQNNNFLKVFLNTNINNYYAVLNNLQKETYNKILKKYLELTTNTKKIAKLFSYFNIEYKLQLLDNWPYNKDILYEIINTDTNEIIQKIINKYDIDLSNKQINIETLVQSAKYSVLKSQENINKYNKITPSINIPIHMLNKKLGKRLWNSYDIFKIRRIINDLEYSTNPENINNYIKQKEETIINNYNEYTLNNPYKEIFISFKNKEEAYIKKDNNYNEYRLEYIKIINKYNNNIYKQIEEKYKENNIEGVYNYLKELNDREISNYIIDYHFEENYHNIIIDIQELLKFYYNGNIIIPEEHIELYNKILNIDYLSLEEKKELHTKLKNINIKEQFYEDMSQARYIVNESIKEYSLTSSTLKKYKDEELTKKYGVDIYKIANEPFFGIVKTGNHNKDILPTGHSYSLIGNNCLAVFGNKNSKTYLYDAETINPEQIVHVFPYDSYTLYHPFEYINNSTDIVNTLLMPDELLKISGKRYNEILILEKGKQETDIDKSIPELKRIALYCQDEIRTQDIEEAKDKKIGIILVKSKKYINNQEYYKNKYKDQYYNYEYFNDNYEKEKFEAKR